MSLPNMDKTSPIAIVGGGAWGLSTTLHLVESGYTNITVFERDERIPSQYSAAYDLNKIIRAEYEDPFYTELTFVSDPTRHHRPDGNPSRTPSKAGRHPSLSPTTTRRATSTV